MPVLTDRKEPEDFDSSRHSDDPNEYALRYLFNTNRNPNRDLSRAGRVLILVGVLGSIIAFGVMVANLEFQLDWALWVGSLLLLLAQYVSWRKSWPTLQWSMWAIAPVLVVFVALLIGTWLNSPSNGTVQMVHFIPASLASLLGGFLLSFNDKNNKKVEGD